MNMWKKKTLVVDEFEALESKETMHLLSTIINLTFVGLVKDQVRYEMFKDDCDGTLLPTLRKMRTDLQDIIIYIDEALPKINYSELWETVHDVCHFLSMPLDNSWQNYLEELEHLPMSTIHLALLELENYPRTSTLASTVTSIIYHGHFKIHYKAFPYHHAHNA